MNPSSIALSLITGALLAGAALAQDTTVSLPDGAPAGLSHVDRFDLRRHAHWLADDARGGRYTGTRGQLEAADYIAEHFALLGFEPLGDDHDGTRSFLQQWPVVRTRILQSRSGLRFGKHNFPKGYGVLPGQEIDSVGIPDGELLFCSYGAPDDSPAEIGPNEIPLVLVRTRSRDQMNVNAQFMMGFQSLGKSASIARKLYEKGARVVVFGVLHDDSGVGEILNYAGLLPGKPLLQYDGDAGMAAMVANARAPGPMVFLSGEATRAALATLGMEADEDGRIAQSAPAVGRASAGVQLAIETAGSHAVNVCAVLRGSDPDVANEALVISAHMDHMGTRVDGDVFNGADDNGSGSASLLEVAEAFARGDRPRRSVVFLSVAGEELGLWGSEYYATHPTWPLADTIANVNIDMIGRVADLSGADEISITPSHSHKRYSSIGRTAARLAGELGLGLTIGDMFYTRSDHYNFAERGVPVVFFCDGEHEDYHQVTDTADKLDYRKIERVARLAYWTAFEVVNAEGRPSEIGRQSDWLDGDGGR